MPDGAIVIPDTAAAPKDYTLSGAQEIALKSVRAVIDGSGAASAFLPTLQLLDPNGHVMWEGASSTEVAAGGSADVSWFPGLGGFGQGATNAEWFIARRTTNMTMLAGAQDTVLWSDLTSSDTSLFSLSTVNHPNDAVAVARQGVIVLTGYLEAGALEPNFVLGVLLNSTNGVSMNTFTPATQLNTLGAPALNPFGPAQTAIVIPDIVPYTVTTRYDNFDAANRVLAQAQMWGLWWPTGALSPF